MTDLPALRASDADRDRTIVLLREHTAVGRLTLEEFTDRMSAAALARTHAELEELTRDLPAAQAPVAARRRATRFVLSIFGSVERHGRFRAGRRIVCVMAFGSVDLNLRQATAEHPVITIFALGGFGANYLMRFHGHRRGCGFAGADGPYGLISDDERCSFFA